jgi:AhpD family alkylhydroperoxidase
VRKTRPPEELVRGTSRRFAELRRERPDEIQAFGDYLRRARQAGALSAKVKELMNLAIALATHCTPCVVRHTKMSLEHGATRDEILETALVAVGMGGGLAYTQTVYMMEALETWAAESGTPSAEAQAGPRRAAPL